MQPCKEKLHDQVIAREIKRGCVFNEITNSKHGGKKLVDHFTEFSLHNFSCKFMPDERFTLAEVR